MTFHLMVRPAFAFSGCLLAAFLLGCDEGQPEAASPETQRPVQAVSYRPTPCELMFSGSSPKELRKYRKDKVRVLHLSFIKDSDLLPLLKVVATFENLETLSLSVESNLDGCWQYLSKLKNLRALLLYGAPVSKHDLRQRKALPKLEGVGVMRFAGEDREFEELEDETPHIIWDKLHFPRCRKLFDGNGCPSTFFRENYLYCKADEEGE